MGFGPNTRDTRATESRMEEHIRRDSRSRNNTATAGVQRVPSHLLVALAFHPEGLDNSAVGDFRCEPLAAVRRPGWGP
jgi:hypothetical protein